MTHYRLGLVGYPLEYSLSPRLHQAAFEALNLEGRYDLFPFELTPEGIIGIQGLIKQLRSGELHGLNVTIPHKMALIPYLDELSPIAQAIGAVNSIRWQAGKVVGENFDCPAFIDDLTHQLIHCCSGKLLDRPGRTALVLGAGGSARAVVYGLLSQDWQVMVASRRCEQAQELVQAFHAFPLARYRQLDALARSDLEGIDLIVNATPLGMPSDIWSSAWPEGLPFPSTAFVYDLVYSPPETAMLRYARQARLQTANGLGMLIRQAAMSFRSWTGMEPPIDVMCQSINAPTFHSEHINLSATQ